MSFKIHSLKLSLEFKEITQYDIKHNINNGYMQEYTPVAGPNDTESQWE